MIHLLNAYDEIKAFKKKESLLSFLEPKFKHEPWFSEIQTRTFRPQLSVKSSVTSKKSTLASPLHKNTNNTFPSKDNVSGNTVQTVEAIKKLKKALEKIGASFSSELAIIEKDGDIVVRCLADNLLQSCLSINLYAIG